MIKTDKYKKGIMTLSRKAAEINPQLGYYESHFITKNAMFIVQLTNGQLEVDIELAREYEFGTGNYVTGKLRKVVFPYQDEHESHKNSNAVNAAWRRLFSKQRKFL